MKKKAKTALIISLISLFAVGGISTAFIVSSSKKFDKTYGVSDAKAQEAYKFLKETIDKKTYTYYDFKLDNPSVDYSLGTFKGNTIGTNVVSDNYDYHVYNASSSIISSLEFGDSIEYKVNVDKAGLYEVNVDYLIKKDNILTAPVIGIMINDKYQYEETDNISCPLIWEGTENVEFPRDSYGDETIPLNVRNTTTWQTLDCYDNLYSSSEPLLFKLESGENTIKINYISGSALLLLGDLYVKAPTNHQSYEQYISNYQDTQESSFESIDAIRYNSKNSSYISLANEKSSSVAPYDIKTNYLNVVSVDTWDDAGQTITYKINAKNDGLYSLAFHYQNDKNEYDAFRTIMIDGKVPFKECINYSFASTTSGKWKNEILNIDGTPMKFYLTKGEHYLSLKAERDKVYNLTNNIQTVIDHINYFALEILKVTGSEVDKDRTWKLTQYIENTAKYLDSYDTILKNVADNGRYYSTKGISSATLSYVNKAITTLVKLMEKPDELPLYLKSLYSGTSSINQLLGSSITMLNDQPIGLDAIYVYQNYKLPKENSSFFRRLFDGINRTFRSYTSSKYDVDLSDDVVDVWVNRPLTYINILQQMVDRDFNTKDGMPKIKITMMPDAGKLLLSTSAGTSPDVVLGIPSYTPFDFAIRNAAYDLTTFPDFYQVADRFPSGVLVPFVLNDKFYAIPESIDFQVTLYRKDIFDSFGLEVPDNWEELKDILKTLQQYGMNYYFPTSANNSTKWFYQTSPLIYQYGGHLYNPDGTSTAIDSEKALKGLTLLTDLYKYYSLDSQVASFYNSFRNGTHPIGMGTFSEYLLINNAAPEIIGKWGISAPLGVKDEETGNVDRTFISSGTCSMILSDTKKANESWEFLKWWTDTTTQIEYSNRLQSTYGPEYTWLSSNIDAIKESPIESSHKGVILDALEYIVDVPRTPGQYMLERGLSNIWTKVALQGAPIGVTIDAEVITINREIVRKMKEFNYLDANGKVLKPYTVREKDWVDEIILSHKGG